MKMIKRGWITALYLLLFVSLPLQADEQDQPLNAQQWLDKLKHVVSQTNFEATFVLYRMGEATTPYLWRHGVMANGVVMEQLNVQNGPGREFIRVDNHVSVFEPDVPPYTIQSASINGPIPGALLHHHQSLYDAYEFVVVGRSRISGKPAQQIRVVSLDNTRFSYELWLDEKTGMLLKFNMLDKKGTVLEQIQMSAFRFTDDPHPYFSRVNQSKLPKLMARPSSQLKGHSWKVGYLPVGMHEVRQDTRRLAVGGHQVEYMLFSDGLTDISIYVEPATRSFNSDFVLRHKLSTFVSRNDSNLQVTVIGEIPPETANAIAMSIERVPQS